MTNYNVNVKPGEKFTLPNDVENVTIAPTINVDSNTPYMAVLDQWRTAKLMTLLHRHLVTICKVVGGSDVDVANMEQTFENILKWEIPEDSKKDELEKGDENGTQ